jgi:response regulator of citrate/malate metabolism
MEVVIQPEPNTKDDKEAPKKSSQTTFGKVVMCKSMRQQDLITGTIKSGAIDLVIKPFQLKKVLAALKKYY